MHVMRQRHPHAAAQTYLHRPHRADPRDGETARHRIQARSIPASAQTGADMRGRILVYGIYPLAILLIDFRLIERAIEVLKQLL